MIVNYLGGSWVLAKPEVTVNELTEIEILAFERATEEDWKLYQLAWMERLPKEIRTVLITKN